MDKWIACSDRLPPSYFAVLIGRDGHSIRIAEHFGVPAKAGATVWRSYLNSDDIIAWEPTHWMPLPHPPPAVRTSANAGDRHD